MTMNQPTALDSTTGTLREVQDARISYLEMILRLEERNATTEQEDLTLKEKVDSLREKAE
jgi:hypothetical protein